MDPVVGTIMGSILVAAISGFALVRSTQTNSIATQTAALVNAQQTAIGSLEARLVARDVTIEQLREGYERCHRERNELKDVLDRQHNDIDILKQRLDTKNGN